MKALLWSALAFLLAVCVLVPAVLHYEPVLRAGHPAPVIYPGRESRVMDLLEPLLKGGFRGHGVASIQIERAEIRVQLAPPPGTSPEASCGLREWARPPGVLVLSYRPQQPDSGVLPDPSGPRAASRGLLLGWMLCAGGAGGLDSSPETGAAAVDLLAKMSRRHRGDIWGLSNASNLVGTEDAGILTPLIRGTGVHGKSIISSSFAMSLVLSAAFAVWLARSGKHAAGPESGSKPSHGGSGTPCWVTSAALVLLLAAGIFLRVRMAAAMPLDSDETWSIPLEHPVLAGDHDAWVHPPVHRALQQLWAHGIGWQEGGSLLWLRMPSVVFSSLALLALAISIAGIHARPWAAIPFGMLALSPHIIQECVLARPYALAALLVTLTAVALWAQTPDEPPATQALRWLVALAAAGLAGWTDLIAGLVAGLMLAVRLIEQQGPSIRHATASRAIAIALGFLWTAALLPGALQASALQLRPEHHLRRTAHEPTLSASDDRPRRAGAPNHATARPAGIPDLRPDKGMGGGHRTAFARSLLRFAIGGDAFGQMPVAGVALVLMAVFAALGLWTGSGLAGVAALAAGAVILILSTRVAMRPRNVLVLPHLLLAAWSWILSRAVDAFAVRLALWRSTR